MKDWGWARRAGFIARSRVGQPMPSEAPSDEPRTGDLVRLQWRGWAGDVVHEGRLLPPALPEHVTLKLISGYNVSHPVDGVQSLVRLGEPPQPRTVAVDVPQHEADLPRVAILHTGGTIASRVDYETGAVSPGFDAKDLLLANPELAALAHIETDQIGNMWSDDLRPVHWNRITTATEAAFARGVRGVVISHGTDTLHITAGALAFAWAASGGRPPGPLVLTGSQRSSDRGSSDASENLRSAVAWAARGPLPHGGLRDASVVVMHATSDDGKAVVLPGCAVRKLHSSRRSAFEPINADPLGWVDPADGAITLAADNDEARRTAAPRAVTESPTRFDPDVRIRQLLAGPLLQPDEVEDAILADVPGLLLHGTGLGHLPIDDPLGDAPENPALADALARYIGSGGVAAMVTQCVRGPVNLDVYAKGRAQQALGLLGHGTHMGPDIAAVKLHWLLSQHGSDEDGDLIASAWTADLVGENPARLQV